MTLVAVFSSIGCVLLGYVLPLNHGITVTVIEQIQALWLLFCGIYAYKIHKKCQVLNENQAISLWLAAIWWLLLGRSMAWGRDYFPDDVPRLYFQPLALILVGLPIYLLCRRDTRRQMKALWLKFRWPVWLCLATTLLFIAAQVIESERLFSLLPAGIDPDRRDLIEELFETPFMFFLFWVNWLLYQQAFFPHKQAPLGLK
ncbi:MAG: hypothetical protein KA214_07960 [Neisseriaceae bacterium]|nr:hypothetical protein [Neisseriaceae bacterium]